jgi:hypothetical protein
MQITEEQKKKLENSFLKKWFEIGPPCPICQEKKWEVDPNIGEIPDFQGKQSMPKQVYPVIIVTCTTCGYCALFSAIGLGLIQPDAPESDANREGATQ